MLRPLCTGISGRFGDGADQTADDVEVVHRKSALDKAGQAHLEQILHDRGGGFAT